MEIRIWLPESIAAMRYMLKHPRYFIIGAYGFDRWFKTNQKALRYMRALRIEENKHRITRNKLIKAQKELTTLKRNLKP